MSLTSNCDPRGLATRPAIEAMYARCSVESRYGRFLAPLPRIPSEHLRRVVTPASGDEAWVVGMTRDDPDTVVALGSWSPAADRDAELAQLVEDAWQCCGIGTALLRVVADGACRAGVRRLTATARRESRHGRS